VAFDRWDFFEMLHKFDQKPQDQWIGIVDNSVDLVRLKIEGKIGELLLVKCIKNILSKWGQEEKLRSPALPGKVPRYRLLHLRVNSRRYYIVYFHVIFTCLQPMFGDFNLPS
jgi:hypothetical protein